jgi:hypothetical protein
MKFAEAFEGVQVSPPSRSSHIHGGARCEDVGPWRIGAPVGIRDVNDSAQWHCFIDRVLKGQAEAGETGWVHHDRIEVVLMLMHPVNQLSLAVGLDGHCLSTQFFGTRSDGTVYRRESHGAVLIWLAASQSVQVGSLYYANPHRCLSIQLPRLADRRIAELAFPCRITKTGSE